MGVAGNSDPSKEPGRTSTYKGQAEDGQGPTPKSPGLEDFLLRVMGPLCMESILVILRKHCPERTPPSTVRR